MTAQSPPYALQNSSHSAALFRQATFSAWRNASGTVGPNDLVVAAQSTPNMSVQVSAGRTWMKGTQLASVSGGTWTPQAAYFGINDAPVSLSVAAADPTNPRIDTVGAWVLDSYYSGASNQLVIGIVTGTPAASPVAPALPNNAITLATYAVAANATSIVSANISNATGLMSVARGGILPVPSSDTTAGEYLGVYRDHPTIGLQRWNGSAWGNSGIDTGWITLTPGTGFAVPAGSGVGCAYRVLDGVCYLRAELTGNWAAGAIALTLPSGALPAYAHWWSAVKYGNAVTPVYVDIVGRLICSVAAGASSGLFLSASFAVG